MARVTLTASIGPSLNATVVKPSLQGLAPIVLLALALVAGPPAEAGKVYFAQQAQDGDFIRRADLDGSNVETVLSTVAFDLAIDPEARKLYWTGAGIRRAGLDGSNEEIVIFDDAFFLALDLPAQQVYWTKIGNPSEIRRANFDGSNIETLVDLGLNFSPRGIALDVEGGKMYFADADAIRRASLDGSIVEFLLFDSDIPYGIALDVADNRMYWAPLDNGDILRADLDGSNVETVISGGNSFNTYDVALDLRAGKLYFSDFFVNSGLWRTDLDGSDLENIVPGSGAFMTGVALDLCGDGTVDPGEKCDDGNTVDGDGCDSNCTVTACGNGIVTAGEQCDDGNSVSGDGCEADCSLIDIPADSVSARVVTTMLVMAAVFALLWRRRRVRGV